MTRSLSYEGRARKQDLVVKLCGALARSVIRSGDRFALIGFDSDMRPDCFMPPKGAASDDMRPVLMPTMPYSRASATRQTRLRLDA